MAWSSGWSIVCGLNDPSSNLDIQFFNFGLKNEFKKTLLIF